MFVQIVFLKAVSHILLSFDVIMQDTGLYWLTCLLKFAGSNARRAALCIENPFKGIYCCSGQTFGRAMRIHETSCHRAVFIFTKHLSMKLKAAREANVW